MTAPADNPRPAAAGEMDDFGRLLHERDVLLDVLREVRLRVFDVYPMLDDATERRVLDTLARYGDVTDRPTPTPPRSSAPTGEQRNPACDIPDCPCQDGPSIDRCAECRAALPYHDPACSRAERRQECGTATVHLTPAPQPPASGPAACQFKRTSMTPCVVEDGECARADDGCCVGCGRQAPTPPPRDDSGTYGELPASIRACIIGHEWDNMTRDEQRAWLIARLDATLSTPPRDDAGVEVDLDAIEARANAATAGSWGVLPSAHGSLAHVETQEGCSAEVGQGFAVCSIPKRRIADAEFIAAARTDVPALVAALRAARQRLAAVEWQLTTARSALENWGHHHSWCQVNADTPCNCGLHEAIAAASPTPTRGRGPQGD